MSEPINPALSQGAQDVPPDPSPGQGEPQEPTQSATPPGPGAGQQPGDADSGDDDGKRTPDNVRGELLRKMEQQQAALDQKFARLEGLLEGVQAQPAAPAPQQPQGPPQVTDMTSAQLEALRPQVPEANHAELDQLIQQRRIDEAVSSRVDQALTAQTRRQTQLQANQTAHARWPELRDPGSRFYQLTNQILNERGDMVANDPTALLSAANEAGMQLGLRGQTTPTLQRGGLNNVPPNSQPPQNDPQKPVLSQEKADEIAANLQGALPDGKKFDMKRVQKRYQHQQAERGTMVKGGN